MISRAILRLSQREHFFKAGGACKQTNIQKPLRQKQWLGRADHDASMNSLNTTGKNQW